MNISEMHVWFRQYAQQMGMQNVKAILPEQIDLLINTSIIDTVNQIITQTIGVTNDRIISDSSKIGQINALKPLYKVATLNMFGIAHILEYEYELGDVIDSDTKGTIVLEFTKGGDAATAYKLGFSVNGGSFTAGSVDEVGGVIYTENLEEATKTIADGIISVRLPYVSDAEVLCYSTGTGSSAKIKLKVKLHATAAMSLKVTGYGSTPAVGTSDSFPAASMFRLTTDNVTKGMLFATDVNLPYMYLVDFSLDYKSVTPNGGMKPNVPGVTYDEDGFVTKYYPVRLVDDAYLADTLNDYILSPRPRSPILTVNANTFDLYFGDFKKYGGGFTLDNNLVPYTLRVSYIAKPNAVKYAHDIGGTDIDCNLPDYLHIDILKHAVDLWRNAVGGSQPMVAQPQQGQQANGGGDNSYSS